MENTCYIHFLFLIEKTTHTKIWVLFPNDTWYFPVSLAVMWLCDWFWFMWCEQKHGLGREGAGGSESQCEGWSSIHYLEPWSGLEGGNHVFRWLNLVPNGILRLPCMTSWCLSCEKHKVLTVISDGFMLHVAELNPKWCRYRGRFQLYLSYLISSKKKKRKTGDKNRKKWADYQ